MRIAIALAVSLVIALVPLGSLAAQQPKKASQKARPWLWNSSPLPTRAEAEEPASLKGKASSEAEQMTNFQIQRNVRERREQ